MTIWMRVTTLIVSVVLAGLAGPEPAGAACTAVPAIAHRGGTERYAENTRGAFRYASSVGVSRWETDIQFDATGVPYVLHDSTLDRTTNWTGPASAVDLSAARAKGLRTDDGQYVPSLYEVLTDAAARGATVFAELKTRPTTAELSRVLARLDWTGMRSRTVITSFDGATLLQVKAAAADVRTGLIDELGYQDASAYTPYGTSYLKHKWSVTSDRLADWSGPLAVYAWTADTTSDWQRLASYPRLDGIITDRPAAYQAWARARTC